MKVLFSLFPGREKLLIWLSAAGAAVCAVLGYLFLNPNYRGAYCVSAAVVIILLIFIGAFGLKRVRLERELADKRKLLGWKSDNMQPEKDALYGYALNSYLFKQICTGLAAVILIIIFAFMSDSLGIIVVMGLYLAFSALSGIWQHERSRLFPPNEFAFCDHELIHFGTCVNINGVTAGIYGVTLSEKDNTLHTNLFIGKKTFSLTTLVPKESIGQVKAFMEDLQKHFDEIKKKEENKQ